MKATLPPVYTPSLYTPNTTFKHNLKMYCVVDALDMRFSICVSDVTCKDTLCYGNVLLRLDLFSLQYPLPL